MENEHARNMVFPSREGSNDRASNAIHVSVIHQAQATFENQHYMSVIPLDLRGSTPGA